MKYSFSYIDDVGLLRTRQEDSGFIISSLKRKLSYSVDNQTSSNVNDIIVLCVADGMGGAANGALASAICTGALKEYFLNVDFDALTTDIIGCGKQAIISANEKILAQILDDPATAGMGTTVILGLIFQNVLHVFWIGDSRCYLFNVPKKHYHSKSRF
ncbi:MAG: protein phosphatase 2C domain-containing protein [Saprospiraceae bacterium]|nr:protein phosphatase 2C domain-containing protein [Saprospiraceae bacterium]